MSPNDRFRTKRAVPKVESPAALPPVDHPVLEPAEEPSVPILSPERAGRPLDFSVVRMILGRKHIPRKRAWPLEVHWYQCLLFPFRSWPLAFGLAFGMAILAGVTAHLTPEIMKFSRSEPAFWVLCWSWGIITLVACGYVVGYLECTLASALAGEVGQIRWPGESLRIAMRSFCTWTYCFLVGPVIPAVVAWLFWLNCGDPAAIDWFILTELVAVGFGYWMLAVVAAGQRDRLFDANPVRIGATVQKIGVPALVALAIVSLLTMAHIIWFYIALVEVRADPLKGWLNLAGCCVTGLYVNAFLMRLLGVSCHLGTKPPLPAA